MSVQNQTVKNVYAGNGSTTVFPFTFALNAEDGEYVGVYVTNDDDVSEKTTNFTIDTTAKTVTYPNAGDPLATGKKITLRREIPNEQELNLENLGPFFAEDVEGELDRIVMMIQQIYETNSRAITTDMASDETPEEFKDRLLASSEAAAASAAAAATSETHAAQWAEGTDAQVQALGGDHSSKNWVTIASQWTEGTDEEVAALGGTHSSEGWADVSAGHASDSEDSATASAGSASDSADSATLAQKWAESSTSPDGETDTDSDTGYTKSSKTWALAAKADSLYADQIASQLEGIVAPLAWDPTETYNYPDIVAYTDGYTYRCVGTNVTGTDVPGQSTQWVSMMYGLSAFELDANGDLMPCATIFDDSNWEIDANGNLMPVAS